VLTISNPKLIYIKKDATMAFAKELMSEKRIRHLPVVDEQKRIVAMLSKHDLNDDLKYHDMPVDLFATYPIHFVNVETSLSSVALKMVSDKISAVILCNDKNEAVGIITTDDLLFQFATLLQEKEKADFSWKNFDALATAGELMKKLSDVGI
jgi:acetoin utilization protein AcuB